jgi:hypothetical protein
MLPITGGPRGGIGSGIKLLFAKVSITWSGGGGGGKRPPSGGGRGPGGGGGGRHGGGCWP